MAAAGSWQPDPTGEASWRWWDGTALTRDTAPARPDHGLQPLRDFVGRSLVLDQEHGSGTDVLRCGETVVGLMHKPAFGELTGEAASGAWWFDREGIVTGRARVLVEPSRQEIGVFAWDGVGSGTDGTLQFPDGRWFRLARATQLEQEGVASPAPYDPSHAVWVWYAPNRAPLMTVRLAARIKTKKIFGKEITYTSSSTGKTGDDIWTDLHAAAAQVPELPLLTLLGTFLIWWTTTQREAVRRSRF